MLEIDNVPSISVGPFAVKVPDEIDKVPSIFTVFPLATSVLLAPVASSPLETVRSPSMSNSVCAVFVPPLRVKLKKLLLVPAVTVVPVPLRVTVAAEGVKPPLFPLSSQLPATSTSLDPGAKVPEVNVKLPLMSRALCAVFVPVAFIVKAEK